MSYLIRFLQVFNIARAWRAWVREREAARAAERTHQLQLVDLLATRLVEFAKTQSEPLLAIAKAQEKQSEILANWLKGFQTIPEPVPSHTVTEEDEWLAEQRERAAAGDPNALPVNLPPEFQLAYILDQVRKDAEDFDREV